MTVIRTLKCPECGAVVETFKNPMLAVDIIIELPEKRIVLIRRKNLPYGWALPGGFVDYGESLESAAMREAEEETGLRLASLEQFRAYSDPGRDPRGHTVSVVFFGTGTGVPCAADDADSLALFGWNELPEHMAFDHKRILADFSASTR